MGRNRESPTINGNESLLNESQRVLEQQVKIIQNQQSQATKIIRVALTIAGLLLTATSIVATLLSSNGSSDSIISDIGSMIPELSFSSAAVSILLFYSVTILLGGFATIFISAFEVLSPEARSSRMTFLPKMLDLPFLGNFIKIYFKVLPVSSTLIDSIQSQDSVSLRPGIDGEKTRDLLKETSEEEKMNQMVEYNAGCIEKNERLIRRNRRLLSTIYSTAILISALMFIGLFVAAMTSVLAPPVE